MRSGAGQSRVLSHLAGAGEAGREGAAKLRVFLVISVTYILFWGPLFAVTLINWGWEWKDAKKSLSHEVRPTHDLMKYSHNLPMYTKPPHN